MFGVCAGLRQCMLCESIMGVVCGFCCMRCLLVSMSGVYLMSSMYCVYASLFVVVVCVWLCLMLVSVVV